MSDRFVPLPRFGSLALTRPLGRAFALALALLTPCAASAQQAKNWIATGAAASCLVVKPSPGSVREIDVSSTASGWAIVIDAAVCPSNGSVTPVKAMPLGQANSGQFAWNYTAPPLLWFQNGVTVLVSSTGPFTYTAEATAFIMGVTQ